MIGINSFKQELGDLEAKLTFQKYGRVENECTLNVLELEENPGQSVKLNHASCSSLI